MTLIGVDGYRTLATPTTVSVIVSTYNSPQSLEKVIWGYAVQTLSGFELVIADDGSTAETADLLQRLRNDTGLTIQHVWHADEGFRKCRILNQATAAATGEYLVFTDGDCIPRRDFLEAHLRAARRYHFLSGGCIRLPLTLSERISVEDIVLNRSFSASWLMRRGAPPNVKLLKLLTRPGWRACFNRMTPTRPTWNGHNASGWKADLLAVNGFDERMRYGGEDRELGERLINLGVRPQQIRFSAVCLHLEHQRGYVNDADWECNRQIRRETRRTHATYTPFGIQQVPAEQTPVRRVA